MSKLPARLHHTAYVTKDQEKTRQFYEDVIGLPLTATWCETGRAGLKVGQLRATTEVNSFGPSAGSPAITPLSSVAC